MVGRQMPPLPAPKTKILAIETKKRDGKGRVESANSGASASGRPMPLPVLKPKAPAIEAKKQDGKAKAESAIPGGSRDRQADAVAGAEIEDPGDRSQETGRQRQSGVRQRRRDCGWRQAKGSKPSRLGIRALTISVTRPMAVSGSSVCTTSKKRKPRWGKAGFSDTVAGGSGGTGATVLCTRVYRAAVSGVFPRKEFGFAVCGKISASVS